MQAKSLQYYILICWVRDLKDIETLRQSILQWEKIAITSTRNDTLAVNNKRKNSNNRYNKQQQKISEIRVLVNWTFSSWKGVTTCALTGTTYSRSVNN